MQTTLSPLNETTLAGVLDPLFPIVLRAPRNEADNAIEYRNIMLLGAQGSGKTTTSRSIAWTLNQRYRNVLFYLQVAGVDRLLNEGTRKVARCWLLVADDVTLAKIPKSDINRFFQVRHLIAKNTGLRSGLAVTMFATHTFHGLEKNLRDTFQALIVKSVPTNPYDRSILRRYFDPWLMNEFSRGWSIDQALVWSAAYPSGTLARVNPPAEGAIENVTIQRSFWSRLFGSGGQ